MSEKLAIIVPYRDREEHLSKFLPAMKKCDFLDGIDYEIMIVEQEEGKPFNLVVKATDPDGSPLTFSLVGGPVGLTVTSAGALTWTPSEEQGPSTNGVGIAVTDGIDSVTNRFTLVVKEVNALPQIAAVPSRPSMKARRWS